MKPEMIPFWTGVAAVAASVSALVAAIYTAITFRLVRMQGDPKVVVYVTNDPDRQTILMIRIENIGRDVASDIRFRASRPIPSKAYGLNRETAEQAEPMKNGPLVDGIRVLGPGDRRDVTWGQFGGLLKALGDDAIVLDFTYRRGRHRFRGRSWLDVASLHETDASQNPAESVAESLRRIEKTVAKIERALVRE